MTFKQIISRFTRTVSVMDLRPSESTRKARAERYARKNKTCGKPATFAAKPLGCVWDRPGMAR